MQKWQQRVAFIVLNTVFQKQGKNAVLHRSHILKVSYVLFVLFSVVASRTVIVCTSAVL